MIHYIFLTVFTAIIAFLTGKIWKKTKQMAFPLGIALMYYWSLAGAWFIVFDELTEQKGKEFGLHYYYLMERMFPVHADNTYLLSISLYAVFIIVTQLTILFTAKRKELQTDKEVIPVRLNHLILIGICVSSAILSFFLVWKEILTAAKFEQSIYVVTRLQPGKLFTIHQLLNEVSVIVLYIGLISCISGTNSKYISGDNSKKTLAAYIASILFVEFYLLLIGNKREILFAGILAMIFYFNNIRFKANWKTIFLFILIITTPLFFNDGFRSYSPSFLADYFDVSGLEFHPEKEVEYSEFTIKNTAFAFLFSNEMFCSHFSMYGVLNQHIPLTYGSSFTSLIASFIPRILWPDRPETIYNYYFEQIHATHGQGYTIHHAAGWYLNFGIIGVLLGGVMIGFLWTWLYNKFIQISLVKGNFTKVVFILGMSAFTSQIASLIRGGPEGYKAMLLEAILIPSFILFISTRFNFKKEK